jgi:cephalosporin-C deacetylase-like acetyl esterase
VQDVIDALDYLFSLPGINTNDIELVGYGKCGLVALHAAAIDTRISEVKIIQSVSTWMDIIKDPLAKDHLSNVVPRAMQYYDLPNLVNVIKPRMVEFAKNVN